MSDKIIFLDFYGVMDGSIYLPRTAEEKQQSHFDPACGARIEQLCVATEASICVISDAVQNPGDNWDKGPSYEARVERAYDDLVECGVSRERIVGHTYQPPDSAALYERVRQIDDWLILHLKRHTHWVIYDDMDLPVGREGIKARLDDIAGWGDQEMAERYRQRMFHETRHEAHFVRVNGGEGLTDADVAKGLEILMGAP